MHWSYNMYVEQILAATSYYIALKKPMFPLDCRCGLL